MEHDAYRPPSTFQKLLRLTRRRLRQHRSLPRFTRLRPRPRRQLQPQLQPAMYIRRLPALHR